MNFLFLIIQFESFFNNELKTSQTLIQNFPKKPIKRAYEAAPAATTKRVFLKKISRKFCDFVS